MFYYFSVCFLCFFYWYVGFIASRCPAVPVEGPEAGGIAQGGLPGQRPWLVERDSDQPPLAHID